MYIWVSRAIVIDDTNIIHVYIGGGPVGNEILHGRSFANG